MTVSKAFAGRLFQRARLAEALVGELHAEIERLQQRIADLEARRP